MNHTNNRYRLKLVLGGIHSPLIRKNPQRKLTIITVNMTINPPNLLWLWKQSHCKMLDFLSFPSQSYFFLLKIFKSSNPSSMATVLDRIMSIKMWSHQHSRKWGRICCQESSIKSYDYLYLLFRLKHSKSVEWIGPSLSWWQQTSLWGVWRSSDRNYPKCYSTLARSYHRMYALYGAQGRLI